MPHAPFNIAVFVFGPPGSGKTTFLKHLKLQYPEIIIKHRDLLNGLMPYGQDYAKKEKAYNAFLKLEEDDFYHPNPVIKFIEAGFGEGFLNEASWVKNYIKRKNHDGKKPRNFAIFALHIYCSDVGLAHVRVLARNEGEEEGERDKDRLDKDVFFAENLTFSNTNKAGLAAINSMIPFFEIDTAPLEIKLARTTDGTYVPQTNPTEVELRKRLYSAKMKEVMEFAIRINDEYAERMLGKAYATGQDFRLYTPPPASPLTTPSPRHSGGLFFFKAIGRSANAQGEEHSAKRARSDGATINVDKMTGSFMDATISGDIKTQSLMHLEPPRPPPRSVSHDTLMTTSNTLRFSYSSPDLLLFDDYPSRRPPDGRRRKTMDPLFQDTPAARATAEESHSPREFYVPV